MPEPGWLVVTGEEVDAKLGMKASWEALPIPGMPTPKDGRACGAVGELGPRDSAGKPATFELLTVSAHYTGGEASAWHRMHQSMGPAVMKLTAKPLRLTVINSCGIETRVHTCTCQHQSDHLDADAQPLPGTCRGESDSRTKPQHSLHCASSAMQPT